jgi:hypothetical protein
MSGEPIAEEGKSIGEKIVLPELKLSASYRKEEQIPHTIRDRLTSTDVTATVIDEGLNAEARILPASSSTLHDSH